MLMDNERLEWLPLSPPKAEETLPAGEPEATCPRCGWPLSGAAAGCSHCGRLPAGPLIPADAPAVELPARTTETPAPPETRSDSRPAVPDGPQWYNLRLQAEQLGASGGFSRLICLDDIFIDQYAYQLETALHVLRDMGGRALLADEVGLGKTIEAGIILKELIERGLIDNALIIVPAPLTRQWQAEMQHKFNETFTVLESLSQLPPPPVAGQPAVLPRGARWIVSLSRARSAQWATRLPAFEYDMLIIDEAHKLKNHRTRAYQFVNRLRKRYVLMLTATPVHNHLLELYNLVTILRPGHLGTRRAFKRTFVAARRTARRPSRRTVYSSQYVPGYLRQSKEKRTQAQKDGWPGLNVLQRFDDYQAFCDHYSGNRKPPAPAARREIESLLTAGYKLVEFESIECPVWPRRRKVDFVCRLKLNAGASTAPLAPRPRQLTPKNTFALRTLLREVMVRNRRSSVGVRLPAREAAVYHLNLSPPERRLYNGVTAYIRQTLALLRQDDAQRQRAGAMRLRLATLQRQLCSTPQAAARGLAALLQREPNPHLADYLTLARSIAEGRKVDAVRVILSQYPGKMLIFTDYLASMRTLDAALTAAGHKTVLFHGGLSSLERFEAVRAFRRSARVMISTRSGGEGHNLQFCRQLINFDLPWNPMRIEQRIGRIHRLGQKETVRIFNLSLTNTIEATILDVLARKIRMFELVIGEVDLILGDLGDERGFEAHIYDMWAGSQSEAEFLQNLTALETLLEQAQQTYTQIRATSDELSDLLGVWR